MSDKTKVKIQISVSCGYDDVFTHQEMRIFDVFSKENVVSVLVDIANDIKESIKRGSNLRKIEETKALESGTVVEVDTITE